MPVVDKTGLTGKYDFTLEWARTADTMPPADPVGAEAMASRPDFFAALKEELGLELVKTELLIASPVIDYIERPSAN